MRGAGPRTTAQHLSCLPLRGRLESIEANWLVGLSSDWSPVLFDRARLRGSLEAEARMHLVYIDETGTTGKKLRASGNDVFVMAGVVVSDEKWHKTHETMSKRIKAAFNESLPDSFELHAHELLAPDGAGPFDGPARIAAPLQSICWESSPNATTSF